MSDPSLFLVILCLGVLFFVIMKFMYEIQRVISQKRKEINTLLDRRHFSEAIDEARAINDQKLIERARNGLITQAVKMTDRILSREGDSKEKFRKTASHAVSLLAKAEADSSYYARIAMRARELQEGQIIYQIYLKIPDGSWKRMTHEYLAELGFKLLPTQH